MESAGIRQPGFWRYYDAKKLFKDGSDVIASDTNTNQKYTFNFILDSQAHLSLMTFKGPTRALGNVGGLYTSLILVLTAILASQTQKQYKASIVKSLQKSPKY